MNMNLRRILEWGGLASGVILIVFGVVAIYMGVDGRTTVRDSLKQEQIYFGSIDDAAVATYASEWADEQVVTGEQARAQAKIMREHTIERTDGLTYAQMGRFIAADDPENPAGTSDEEAALKDESGSPVSNPARNQWVTETALATALNMAFMAEQLSIFGLVVGVALLLTGIGLLILALAVLGGRFLPATAPASVTGKVAASH